MAVPGGTYDRSYDGRSFTDPGFPATVSDFGLDRFEVTVARFRQFVTAYDAWRSAGHPIAGEGADPRVAGTGWDSTWTARIPADAATLAAAVQCDPQFQTWSGGPCEQTRPINCVTWYEAFAFCAWDQGRLSTEAEWNYAAAGGDEQRIYPWGAADPGPSASLAIYNCYYQGDADTCTGVANIAPVGSAPHGDGKYAQADLAGNVSEWTFDSYSSPYPTPCDDCAAVTPGSFRVFRGGDFSGIASNLPTSNRGSVAPTDRSARIGLRCARVP
ncbi:MAG: SUMF1/EgtB/PvdO family nonheme iron enzyme [Myxococcales bacterium]|nr:SUMF1/EgtB/PvdO family nonheme iron enzyme [Myxococcales bacterium]